MVGGGEACAMDKRESPELSSRARRGTCPKREAKRWMGVPEQGERPPVRQHQLQPALTVAPPSRRSVPAVFTTISSPPFLSSRARRGTCPKREAKRWMGVPELCGYPMKRQRAASAPHPNHQPQPSPQALPLHSTPTPLRPIPPDHSISPLRTGLPSASPRLSPLRSGSRFAALLRMTGQGGCP